MTHTYAVLVVSPAVYREVRNRLAAVGYQHAFEPDGEGGEVIDMHGMALHAEPAQQITGHVFQRCSATRPGDEHRADGCKNANRCHWVAPHDCAACGALPEEHLAA